MTKKGLELLPSDRDCALRFMLLLVLLPTEVDAVTQEKCCKGYTVRAFGFGDGKVILTLLAEVIKFHVRFTTIDVS